MSKYTIFWEVDDGYFGKSRHQRTVIDSSWFEDDMSETDIAEEIESIVEEDFQQKMYFSILSDVNSITDNIKREIEENLED